MNISVKFFEESLWGNGSLDLSPGVPMGTHLTKKEEVSKISGEIS